MGQCRVSVARRRGDPGMPGSDRSRVAAAIPRCATPALPVKFPREAAIPKAGVRADRGPGARRCGLVADESWRPARRGSATGKSAIGDPADAWIRASLRRAHGPTAGGAATSKVRFRTRLWSPGRRTPDGARRLTVLNDGVRRPARSAPEGRAGGCGRSRAAPTSATHPDACDLANLGDVRSASPQPATPVGGKRRMEPDPPCAGPPCRLIARKLHPECESDAPHAGRSAWIKAPE